MNRKVEGPQTHFAPAVRSSGDEIQKERDLVASQKFFTEIFGSVPGIAGVIDVNRQIVYSNSDFLAFLGLTSIEPILGKRPGEAVSCIHSGDEIAGCGTSEACAYCGAVNAILESQKSGSRSVKETRITTIVDGKMKSLDLNITSAPISFDGKIFYLLILKDISDEKRRSALERAFFHDLLNSAGGLNGLLKILKEGTDPDDVRELIDLSEEVSRNIIEEILLQRQIRDAETGDLHVKIEKVNSVELLSSAVRKIRAHDVGKEKNIAIADWSANADFYTDRILFQRVIVNLLKNALEATPPQGLVMAGVEELNDKIRFWVKNDAVISKDVQMQLFQRSFSTKGMNRGIGTYSIRLLTENYLRGTVSFVSNDTDGTIFSVELYKTFPSGNADLH